jgi:4-alpha-glucanotransferase
MPAAAGAYVHGRVRELVDVVTVEAHRAGAFVIGEDLGTVEDELREALREAGILGTLLGTFEDGDPSGFREDALATMTTHDLPTSAALLTGADQAMLASLGRRIDQGDMHRRLQHLAGPHARTVAEVVPAAYRTLAAAPTRLVLATLEDALGSIRRPNLPGTIDEYPNWRIPLPVRVEDLATHPKVQVLVAALLEGRAEAPEHTPDAAGDPGADGGDGPPAG